VTVDRDITETISNLFNTTTKSDRAIATSLTKEGIPISARGVKEARLANNWRRRNNDLEQQERLRQATREAIINSRSEGTTYNYGREHLSAALRTHYSHRARHNDI